MLEDLLLTAVSDPDANAWANAVQGAGGFVSGTQRCRVATLIRSLKAASVWPLLDRLWLFAAENTQQALIDIKGIATAAPSGSPVFTANRGYQGAGGKYLDSGFNPSTAGGHYTQNSASFGLWIETADTNTGDQYMGNNNAAATYIQAGTTNIVGNVNGSSNDDSTVPASTTGAATYSRNAASGAGAVAAYVNGVQKATFTDTSTAVANANFYILKCNGGGGTIMRASGAWIGGALTAAQETAFHAARRAYMTAVGVS